MNTEVQEGLRILRDIFEECAEYKDDNGKVHSIRLEQVGPNIDISEPDPDEKRDSYSLSFEFNDHNGKKRQHTVLVPKKYNDKIDILRKAITERHLRFGSE